MAYVAYDNSLGVTDLTIPDSVDPGFVNLVTGTGSGRLVFPGETYRGYDANLRSGGEFIYAKNTTANVTGQTISSGTYAAATGLVTITTGSAHGMLPGATVIMVGQVPSAYVGTYTVSTVPSTTTFTYVPASIPSGAITTVGTYTNSFIQPGHVCEFTYGLSSGQATLVATPWTSTTLQGKSLAVAITPLLLNQWGWFQIEGFAVTAVISGQTPAAGNRIYGGAVNGFSTPTAVLSAQMVNATYASAVSQTIGTGNSTVVLNAQQALVFLNRPFAQGAIT